MLDSAFLGFQSPRDATIRDLKTWRGTIEPKLDTSAAKIDQPEARAGWFPRFGLGMRSAAEKSDARALRSADASAEPVRAWRRHTFCWQLSDERLC